MNPGGPPCALLVITSHTIVLDKRTLRSKGWCIFSQEAGKLDTGPFVGLLY